MTPPQKDKSWWETAANVSPQWGTFLIAIGALVIAALGGFTSNSQVATMYGRRW
jgi:hypothetical protein